MPPEAAIPVSVHGVTWSAVLIGVLNLLVGGALVSWIRSRPRILEIQQNAEDKLQANLLMRVDKLEKKLEEKDRQHEAEMALREAEIAILRHRANNSDQCIDALLLLLEQSPDKAKEAVVMIKDMRSRQREAEAIEKVAYQQSRIAVAAGKVEP